MGVKESPLSLLDTVSFHYDEGKAVIQAGLMRVGLHSQAMNLFQDQNTVLSLYQEAVLNSEHTEKLLRLTPFIITFCEGTLTSIDVQNLIENGLRIVRFKMTHVTRSDKLKLLAMLKDAVRWCCEKYEVDDWPIAISIDIPNACIRTGYLKEEIRRSFVLIEEDWILEITSDVKFWNKCDRERIFIDDSYTIKTIKPGIEISINFGEIVMICKETVNAKTVKCKVIRGGNLESGQFVCIRGIRHKRPPLSRTDMNLIHFAKEFKFDIITINSIRYPETLKKIKSFFKDVHMPKILSTICEQEGLDNIDGIIQESDGIILAREFMASEILNMHQMVAIELQISAKCREKGKPFYISGILERTLLKGTITGCDLTDITNAIFQGSGFVLRSYKDPSNVLKAMKILESICMKMEPLSTKNDFWRMSEEFKVPVNAAEGCILACVLAAKQTTSFVIILLTVTGRTAIQLARMVSQSIILTLTSNPYIARQLQLYRGIIPIIYEKETLKDWYEEMDARIKFAVGYGIKHDLLKYGDSYVALMKSTPTSSFCDKVSIWKVMTEETEKNRYSCRSIPSRNTKKIQSSKY